MNDVFGIETVCYFLPTIVTMIAGETMPAVFTNMFLLTHN